MRRFALLLSIGALVACAERQPETADTTAMGDTAMAPAPAPAPTPISLSDVAGRWTVRGTPETGSDTTTTTTTLTATGTTSGWTVTFRNRRPVPLRVIAVAGDSIVTEAGPYESFRRPGVQVRTRQVIRIQDGRLVGRVEARFATGPDTLLILRTEGTRAP